MSQLVEFSYVTGQTLTAELYAEGSDTVTATAASVTQQTNRNNVYRASFSGVAVGVYSIVVKLSGTAVATGWVHIEAASGTFQVMSRADLRAWRGSTPNALNSGRVDSLTGAMANDVLTAAAIADNAFTAAKFAASSLNGKGDWLLASVYSVPLIAAGVRSELATELARIDVSISSRLASASYTAPANATIATIAAVTAKLDSAMELDGLVHRFTANALELAPGGLTSNQVNQLATVYQKVVGGPIVRISDPSTCNPTREIIIGDEYSSATPHGPFSVPIANTINVTSWSSNLVCYEASDITVPLFVVAGTVADAGGAAQRFEYVLTAAETGLMELNKKYVFQTQFETATDKEYTPIDYAVAPKRKRGPTT